MESNPLSEFCHQVDIGGYHINYVRVGRGPVPIFSFPGLLGKDFDPFQEESFEFV